MKHGLLIAASALALAATSATMTAGTTGAHAKLVNIRLSYWMGPRHQLTIGYIAWGNSIKKATGGSVITTLFPSSQLGSGRNRYHMVKRGTAGFGLINPGFTPGRFPVLGASELPFTIKDSLPAVRALTVWYKKYAAQEMPDQIVCHVFAHHQVTFHTSKMQIRVPSDVKGLIIRSANLTMSRFVTALSGNPVEVPIIQAKDMLANGITDGIIVTFGGLTGPFKFKDVVKYTVDLPLYVATFTHGVNQRLYNGLSAKNRRVIDDHCTPEWSAKVYKPWYDKDQKDQADGRKLKDHTFTKVSPAEVKLWRDAARPVVAAWKTSVKKIGLNPDTVLKEMRDELNKVNALF